MRIRAVSAHLLEFREDPPRSSRLAADVREALGVRSAILDGEVLAIDETGQHNFHSLMSSAGHLHYAAFV